VIHICENLHSFPCYKNRNIPLNSMPWFSLKLVPSLLC